MPATVVCDEKRTVELCAPGTGFSGAADSAGAYVNIILPARFGAFGRVKPLTTQLVRADSANEPSRSSGHVLANESV